LKPQIQKELDFLFYIFFANSEGIDQKIENLKELKNYVLLLKIQKKNDKNLEIFTNPQNQ
jgi:hypothetical protein